jgi:hypothetical protein
MEIKNIKSKVYKTKGRIKAKLEFEIEDENNDVYSLNKKLNQNTWMFPHLVSFYPFDYGYNLQLFSDSLKATGTYIVNEGHFVGNKKTGRRALYASHLIRECYYTDHTDDKSFDNLCSRERMDWKKIKGGMYKIETTYLKDNAMNMDKEEYSKKMFKIIHNRWHKQDNDKWASSWAYLSKYLKHFWS